LPSHRPLPKFGLEIWNATAWVRVCVHLRVSCVSEAGPRLVRGWLFSLFACGVLPSSPSAMAMPRWRREDVAFVAGCFWLTILLAAILLTGACIYCGQPAQNVDGIWHYFDYTHVFTGEQIKKWGMEGGMEGGFTISGKGVLNSGPACAFCGGFKRCASPFMWVYHLHTRGMPLLPHHAHWAELQRLISEGESEEGEGEGESEEEESD
jgi:hypothetical protein